MADNFSLVIQNAREEFLSSDFTRAERLSQIQMLDAMRDQSRSDDAPLPDQDFGLTKGERAPWATGATLLHTITPAAAFTMDVGQGQALVEDGVTGSGLNNEVSSYKVLRTPSVNLIFAAPDAVNPRIDLVVLTDGTVNTDLQSRNILLDPVARTVAAQTVAKRQNPNGVVSLVTGIAAPSPTAPAVPAGTLALFEVLVPALALTSAEFSTSRRLHRRVEFPNSAAHGILQGCKMGSAPAIDPAFGLAQMRSDVVNKVIINGEVIAFHGGNSSGASPLPMFYPDIGPNNPFTALAGTSDEPYYIYACGGLLLPQGRFGSGSTNDPSLEPICLVESLVTPDPTGRPSALINTPRGATLAAAVYIGVGWKIAGTTLRKSVQYSGDWAWAFNGAFKEPNIVGLPAANTPHTLVACPLPSSQAIISAYYTAPTQPQILWLLEPQNVVTSLALTTIYQGGTDPGVNQQVQLFIRPNIGGAQIHTRCSPNADSDLWLQAKAYNMNVRRYGSV